MLRGTELVYLWNNQTCTCVFAWFTHSGFPDSSAVKESAYNAGDAAGTTGSIPGLARCPGEGNGNPLQYSWLGNPTDRGGWQAIVHAVTKESDMTERLNNNNKSFTWCIWKIFFLKICHTYACLLPILLTNENIGVVCHKAECTNQEFCVFILLVFNQCALSFVRKDKNHFLLRIQAENVFPLQSVLKLPVSHH